MGAPADLAHLRPRPAPRPRQRGRAYVGAIAGMAMTEKQGGSDVRANTTRATPTTGAEPR
ncbi:MAG: hypothetical protein R2701_10470 [Acidimicrobiales bacterium]